LFLFWQFNGDNRSFCNQHCPYCYGRLRKTYRHYWNGKVAEWRKAFERLNRGIYFVFSYGEAMGAHGFYECVDLIGEHPHWVLNILTNLSYSPERLIASRLGREKRVFVSACWHPLGVDDRVKGWENFKRNLLMLKEAGIPTHTSMVWYRPQIKWFPEYFDWLDKNDFRVKVRRFIHPKYPLVVRASLRRILPKWFAGKFVLEDYTKAERGYLYASSSPSVIKYGIELEPTYGTPCLAGKDMILVECDGDVKLCADCVGHQHRLGNIFDENFKLNNNPTKCPTNTCGGDYGLLHLFDEKLGTPANKLWDDPFISQIENLPQTSPVAYPHRKEMLKWLEEIKKERSLF